MSLISFSGGQRLGMKVETGWMVWFSPGQYTAGAGPDLCAEGRSGKKEVQRMLTDRFPNIFQ